MNKSEEMITIEAIHSSTRFLFFLGTKYRYGIFNNMARMRDGVVIVVKALPSNKQKKEDR